MAKSTKKSDDAQVKKQEDSKLITKSSIGNVDAERDRLELGEILSNHQFRRRSDLIFSTQKDKLVIPLTQEISDNWDITEGSTDSGDVTFIVRHLKNGDSSSLKGEEYAVVISPCAYADLYCLVLIGITVSSHIGIGDKLSAKLISSKKYIRQIIEVTGDAYRIGSQGYMEFLVLFNKKAVQNFESHKDALSKILCDIEEVVNVRIVRCFEEEIEMNEILAGNIQIKRADVVGPSKYNLEIEGRAKERVIEAAKEKVIEAASEVHSPEERFTFNTFVNEMARTTFIVFRPKQPPLISTFMSSNITQNHHIGVKIQKFCANNSADLVTIREGHGMGTQVDINYTGKDERISFAKALRKNMGNTNIDVSIASFRELKELADEIEKGEYPYFIVPEMFHRHMRKHLCIPDSDAATVALVKYHLQKVNNPKVLEIGAGTGALTDKLIQAGICEIDVIEPDKDFYNFLAKEICKGHTKIRPYQSIFEDFVEDNPDKKYDIIVSQGVHHHIKLDEREMFCNLIAERLKDNGHYIMSDEYLKPYKDDEERLYNLDRWYEDVITTAIAQGHDMLAEMELKFWHGDREEQTECKESFENFEDRIKKTSLEMIFSLNFGLDKRHPYGGFIVADLIKRPEQTNGED